MAFSPQIQSLPARRERRPWTFNPALLSFAAFAVLAVVLVATVAINGVPQLDPQAQMFVTP